MMHPEERYERYAEAICGDAACLEEWTVHSRTRLNILVRLVMFVFCILLLSIGTSFGMFYLLANQGIMPRLLEKNFLSSLLFILLLSLSVGTLLSAIGGHVFLRPLRRVIQGTKEIATGNFDVRVAVEGPTELRNLAVSFNEMAKELNGIETLRDDFVSNISHEFKTPVVSIRGFAKLLKNDTLSPKQRDEYLDIIIQESQRLAQLSSNILLLSQLNNTEELTELEEFPLDEQLRRVILLLDPLLTKKGIDVKAELPPVRITANGEMLQQVWMNLLNNAIKFTHEGGEIGVRLLDQKDKIAVEVMDNGIGMSEETQKRLFDKFYQGDKSHGEEGNGLGLSLVKRIVELNGGSIAVRSTLGQGSLFTLTFPKGREKG